MTNLYNLTPLTNSQDLYDVFVAANEASAGYTGSGGTSFLVAGLLIVFFIMMLMGFRGIPIKSKVLVASSICFIFSVFLRSLELISFTFVIAFGIFSGLAILIHRMIKESGE